MMTTKVKLKYAIIQAEESAHKAEIDVAVDFGIKGNALDEQSAKEVPEFGLWYYLRRNLTAMKDGLAMYDSMSLRRRR